MRTPSLSHFSRARLGRCGAVTAAILLAASAFGEDPSAPVPDAGVPLPMPPAYKSAPSTDGPESVSASVATDAAWWSIFHDPNLDRLEEQAVAANSDLRLAVDRVVEARAKDRAAAAGLLPQVSVPLQASRQHTTNTGPVTTSRLIGGGFGAGFPGSFQGQALENTYSDYQVPLVVGYEVDVFGRIRHARGQARAEAEASQADRQSVKLSLTSQVATTYFALRAADSAVAVLQRTAQLRGDSVQIQQNRLKGGAASDVDFLRARVEQSNTEADLVDAAEDRAELENALAVLCGEPASDFHIVAQPLDQVRLPAVPVTIPAQLLSQRPDLIEAERRIVAAGEGVQVARAEFYPVFNVQAGVGFESSQDNQLLENQSHTWSIAGAINIPIFNGGRSAADLKAARARKEEAFDAYRQSALVALREVEDALSNLRSRAVQADARQRAVADARSVFSATQHSYGEGGLTYFEVIDAQRVLLSAELAGVRTLNARYAATVDLIRATGGAFEAGSASVTGGH
jgi:outer membrane protein, multidrug efflux system